MLQRLEPHSPIPYLINRAVELGALPFPDLMIALIRDAEVLAGMNRELGIKEPEG
jgi:type VI secretion system protein ImpA